MHLAKFAKVFSLKIYNYIICTLERSIYNGTKDILIYYHMKVYFHYFQQNMINEALGEKGRSWSGCQKWW